MQMSRLMVWSTAFSDDERSETEYRLSADETPLTLSGLPPENRDNSRDNIRTKHFIIAKIHIFTQLSKRNHHRRTSRKHLPELLHREIATLTLLLKSAHFVEFVPEALQLDGSAYFVHYLGADEEEAVGLGCAGLGAGMQKQVVGGR